MKECYATEAEIKDSFQNIKKHNMAGIQALNNFSLESESLEKRSGQVLVWEIFYHWESFRIMVLHKVRKSLPRTQKSSESSRCWAPLNQAKWAETCKIMCQVQPLVVLRQQIYNLLQQQNRVQHPPTVHLRRRLSFEEGEGVYQIFSTIAVIFTRDILSRRRNRQQGKSS